MFTKQNTDCNTCTRTRYQNVDNANIINITEEVMLALADKMCCAATQFSNSMQGYDEFIQARAEFELINHQLFAAERSKFVPDAYAPKTELNKTPNDIFAFMTTARPTAGFY